MDSVYKEAGIEPSLAEALADPIVRAVMRRDRVTADQVRHVIRQTRERLERTGRDEGARRSTAA